MERVFKNITDTEQELTVTLSRDEVEPIVSASYQDISKKVHLDGFRPGKVPMHLIKKMYGESIEAEEHSKLAQKYMDEIFKEDNIFAVSQPHLHEIIKKDGGIEFSLHYHYIPDFDLADYKSIVVDEPVHKVTDTEIEQHLEFISYKIGKMEDAEVVTDKNFVVTVFDKTMPIGDRKSEVAELEKMNTFPLNLRRKQLFTELVELFMDKKVDDEVLWTPPQNPDTATEEPEQKIFVIKNIKKIIPNEFSEEVLKKISQDKFSTIEDYKEEIGFRLQEVWDKKSLQIVENNIIDKLVSMHDIKLPEFIVEEQALKMFDDFKEKNKLPDLVFEETGAKNIYLEQSDKIIKWDLIREKIVKAEDIQVEDFDIADYIEKNLKYPGVDAEILLNYVKENKQIINSILVKKVMNFLIDFTTTNEVEFAESELEFDDELDEDFEEEDDIFDADEEFIDEDEFDDEFSEDDEKDDFDDDDDVDDDEDDDDDDDDEEDEDDFDEDDNKKKSRK